MTRTSADISSGLAPVRPPTPIIPGERIHVVGAAGSAGSGAMLLAAAAGAVVSGCDAGEPSRYSLPAETAGIPIAWSHDPAHVVVEGQPTVDRIAVSKALTAVEPDQPELAAARHAGIQATSCQQLIADAIATRGGDLLAVAGTHGKSTTTGWLVHLLVQAGLDPSAFVGALMPAELTGGLPSVVRLGSGPVSVVEADEYAGNFDPYHPDIGLLLNADWDHPDVFADRSDVVATFERWIRSFRSAATGRGGDPARTPVLVANAGDPGVAELLPRLRDWHGRLVVYAVVAASGGGPNVGREGPGLETDYRTAMGPAATVLGRWAVDGHGSGSLTIEGLPGLLRTQGGLVEPKAGGADRTAGWPQVSRPIPLRLPGRHNADDGLGAALTAIAYGASLPAVLDGLASYGGVGRRFELVGDIGGIVVLDDYGHHPTAIAATLDAVAQRYPGRRTWAVYEPLTFHRTAAMIDEFAEVLARADRVAIADIFAVRDPDTTTVSAADLARAVDRRGTPAIAPGSVEQTGDALASLVATGDVVLVMGGGRSSVIARRLVESLGRSVVTDGR